MPLRPLAFPADTLSFANETLWDYALDPQTGRQIHQPRVPRPTYTLRCFPVARAVKQFHLHARFDPSAPPLSESVLRNHVRQVLRRSSEHPSPDPDRILFPGFPDLRALSAQQEGLLKAELGGAWRSYVQRGHWRMVFPFSGSGQAREAQRLLRAVQNHQAPVVHVLVFPGLTINHAVVLFAAEVRNHDIAFTAYDPNSPSHPVEMVFRATDRAFYFPPTAYFIGGRVRAYEVYCGLLR